MKTISSVFLNLILAVIIAISATLIIYFSQIYQSKYSEELEKIRFNQEVYDLAKQLASCLGYEYEKTYYLDYNKIEEFSKEYKDIEPRCAIAKDFDYNVKIIQLEKEIRNYPPFFEESVGKGVAQDILNIINGKKVIFVLDVSGSMSAVDTPPCEGDKYRSYQDSRICCLKKFTLFFLENLAGETEVGINFFGVGHCDFEWSISPYKKISEITQSDKDTILSQSPQDGTPIFKSLNEAARKAERDSYIVLLTDGEETCGGYLDENLKNLIIDKNITLLSIGFGQGADIEALKRIKSQVGGEVYEAKNCEELVEKMPEIETKVIKIEKIEWSFGLLEKGVGGVSVYGPKINLKTQVSIPILIKYNETFIVDGLMIINAYKGFLEEFYSYLDDLCSKNLKNFESAKQFYFDYDVKIEKENDYYKVCSEDVCKKLICKYEIENKEFKRGENIISFRIFENKISFS